MVSNHNHKGKENNSRITSASIGQGQEQQLGLYYVDTKAYEQHKELGLPYQINMLDEELSRFMNDIADTKKIETTITIMCRLKAYSHEDGKQKEYIYWYETIRGRSKDGNTIQCSDIPCGISNQLVNLEYEQGKLIPKQYRTEVVYTVEFNKEYVQELIEKSTRPEAIQFQCNGTKSWAAYTQDEFLNCSFNELDQRGRLGIAGMYDSEFEFTKLPTEQKLAILVNKK